MKIIDITDRYIQHILGEDNLPAYEQTMPKLFAHYFAFWGARAPFHPVLPNEESVKEKQELIRSRLPAIERQLEQNAFDVSELSVVLFVGQGSTNGYAFFDGEKFFVWLPVEAYNTTQEVDIFVTHEIVHALQYTAVPDFYFETEAEKNNMLRQLVTEGVATYLSGLVWDVNDQTALWADSISADAAQLWIRQCAERINELCKFSLAHINESSAGFFQANDSNDIFNYRAGYYVGLEIIRRVARRMQFTPTQLLRVPKIEWKEAILQELQQCA